MNNYIKMECNETLDNMLNSNDVLNSDNVLSSNDVLKLFIETFETLPELWNSAHHNYTNKLKRNIALDKLMKIYSNIKSGATRDDVRKKINTLRSNYRKELKKIIISKRSGCDPDDVYKPTSWVFYSLQFLSECEQQPAQLSQETETNIINEDRPQSSSSSLSSSLLVADNWQAVKENKLLSLACKYLEDIIGSQNRCPAIAKVWGEKLASLDPQQRLFAEKAINDILFEASLGNLHRHSVKINED